MRFNKNVLMLIIGSIVIATFVTIGIILDPEINDNTTVLRKVGQINTSRDAFYDSGEIDLFYDMDVNADQLLLSEISSIAGSRICDVKVNNNILYVLDAFDGLKTYDISDPTTPVQSGDCFDIYTFAHSLIIDDMCAYVADYEDGLEIVNISDPSDLKIIGQYSANVGPTAGSTDVHKSGDLAFLASQNLGLEIINCSDPFNPVKIGSYYDNKRVIRVYSLDDQVLISEAGNGFKILNITDYGYKEVFHFSDTASTQDFFIHNNLLYTTDASFGIRIFDISNLSNIVKVGEKAIGESYGFVVAERGDQLFAYISVGEAGLQILNISEPGNIKSIAQYNDGGYSYNVAVKDELVLIADFSDGLEILQFTVDNETFNPLSIPGFEVLIVIWCLIAIPVFIVKKKKIS